MCAYLYGVFRQATNQHRNIFVYDKHPHFLIVFLRKFTASAGFFFAVIAAMAQAPVANFTANVTTGCGSLIVSFTDLSTNNPTQWNWNFGDGATSTVKNPTHNYTAPGTYNVTLTATNGSGSNTCVKNAYIKVYHLPNPGFSASPLNGCLPLNVCFTNSSTPGDAPITSWSWDFGDGSSGSTQSPCHVYNSAGTFTVTLTANDQYGCTKTYTRTNYITVGSKPVAGFTFVNPVPCNVPVTYTFNNTTVPAGSTYSWNFGDGGTSNQQSPSHNYNSPGNYTVTLIATNNGCTDTAVHVVHVSTNPFDAAYAASPTSGCAPLTVSFTDNSGPNPNGWFWTFGDGGTSTTQNPSHTYSTPGFYTVKLVATNTSGCTDSLVYTNYISVWGPPVVSFSGTPRFACHSPLTTNFTCSVPGSTAWLWDFGDGGTSVLQNPSHTYLSDGIYTVTLTMTDNHGCSNTLTKPNYVIVNPTGAYFVPGPPEGCYPLPVQFTDSTETLNYLTSWSWNFGDGSPISPVQNPSHIYSDTGKYIVVLTVTDSAGCVNTFQDTVLVGMKPLAGFEADDTVGCHKFFVHFTDLSSNIANSWDWDFGDGGTSELQNPAHTYADTGYFDVILIAKHNGCPDTLERTEYIQVLPPKPLFISTPNISCSYPVTVNFQDQSYSPNTWFWDFGDGATSTLQNPTHTYNNPGFYTVKLVVSNPNGCRDSLVQPSFIQISEIIPDFTQSSPQICLYDPVAFMSNSYTNTYGTGWIWDFGDGSSGAGFVVQHFYNAPGQYSVEMKITDALGCNDSITKNNTVTVHPLPSPGVGASSTTICSRTAVQFTDLSTVPGGATLTGWQWNFGDGGTSTQQNPSHVYIQPGVYTVTLSVTDSRGCDSTRTFHNMMTVTRPSTYFVSDTLKCNMQTVNFFNGSSGGVLSYAWNFDDGSPVSSQTNPTHVYSVGQTTFFDVMLTATDTNGCDSSFSRQIKISRPVPEFYSNTLTANCPPLLVPFYDSSSVDVISWYWTFGDTASGGNNHSALQDPQHIYNQSGTFDVQLVVTNSDGCIDSVVKTNYITINGPTGSFAFTPPYGCAPLAVDFTASAMSTTSYFWVFGDGNATTTTVNTTSHTYDIGGAYLPTLVLQDSVNNCNLTIISPDSIRVISGYAAFAYSAFVPCSDTATIFFTDTSHTSHPVTAWQWDFGDGSGSNQQNPSHFYSQDGTFDVTLTIWVDSCQFSVIYPGIVTIFIPPDIEFQLSGNSTCTPPLLSQFIVDDQTVTDSVSGWQWDFGDGTTGSGKNPTHNYYNTGSYDVTLSATFVNGCTVDYTEPFAVYVYNFPSAGFYTDTNNVLAGEPIGFIDTSSGASLHWAWEFGDGGTSTVQNPVYAYSEAGEHQVMLIVSTPNGCSDTAWGSVNILDDIIIPNVFTPNGDGYNDVFEIISRGFINYKLLIYNRWGKIVFETDNPTLFWDGTQNGEKVADGTYFYTIDLGNQVKKKALHGSITVIR